MILLLDSPRYALGEIAMCLWDFAVMTSRQLRGTPEKQEYSYCPTVCVILAGLNEAKTIIETLSSIWGTYPRMEIIIVDDGSDDNMSAVAKGYAATHPGIVVLRKKQRGGKSSALNFALAHTKAEIIVGVDTDSHLDVGAIWEIV